ncbi:hypothetical protein AWV80_17515 [Cupriavidus sp. UYMU48A]|nr:hypothetical protein AWV80_17515 [Cupriavidus sp. UYMU48A]
MSVVVQYGGEKYVVFARKANSMVPPDYEIVDIKTATGLSVGAPAIAAASGDCMKSPLEIFPTGETIPRQRLMTLTYSNCKGAKVGADDAIEVVFEGKTYVVLTKPSPNSRGALEITAIRGKAAL